MSPIESHGLSIDKELHQFLIEKALPGTGVDPEVFLKGFSAIVHDLAPKNRALLAKRDEMQAKIDAWHKQNGAPIDMDAYEAFLREIGYLLPEGGAVKVSTSNVDAEITTIAGPQLVVPVMNARYALNAANARWGSLYDALYGTDAIAETDGAEKGKGYNPLRGAKVIAWGRQLLDDSAPLAAGSWSNVAGLSIQDGALFVSLSDGGVTGLSDPAQLAGYRGAADKPEAVLLVKNNLHTEIVIDANGMIGKTDPAHIDDIWLESAITTIMDCEDSVAAVDAEDKVVVYDNWLGLMKGDLTEEVAKGGKTFTRALNADRSYTKPDGSTLTLHGRSLMLVRNVGHLMTNPAILDRDGNEIP
ncbi:MAG: malate synthase G, partial [Rhizobium sp.]|nr:malate synthase G [Rhizobium sp.]